MLLRLFKRRTCPKRHDEIALTFVHLVRYSPIPRIQVIDHFLFLNYKETVSYRVPKSRLARSVIYNLLELDQAVVRDGNVLDSTQTH